MNSTYGFWDWGQWIRGRWSFRSVQEQASKQVIKLILQYKLFKYCRIFETKWKRWWYYVICKTLPKQINFVFSSTSYQPEKPSELYQIFLGSVNCSRMAKRQLSYVFDHRLITFAHSGIKLIEMRLDIIIYTTILRPCWLLVDCSIIEIFISSLLL